MNIVEPYARLGWVNGRPVPVFSGGVTLASPDVGVEALKQIEWAARISHRSEEKQGDDTWRRFLTAVVLEHGDWSVVEHVSATVDFLVDRGITHELVRHRLVSPTQESTRFVNYDKKLPPSFIYPDPDNWEGYIDDPEWCECIVKCEETYKSKLKQGWPPQKARSVFPNALASRIVDTANLRTWRHLLLMRTTKESHPQMRQVTIPLLAQFKATIPLLYDDIAPESRQIDNLKLPR